MLSTKSGGAFIGAIPHRHAELGSVGASTMTHSMDITARSWTLAPLRT
jgi:hypothetical protein